MQINAFARSKALFALIAACMGDTMKINALGRYKSRGHGEGCTGNKHAKPSFK